MQSTCMEAYLRESYGCRQGAQCATFCEFQTPHSHTLSLWDYLFVRHLMKHYVKDMELTDSAKLHFTFSQSFTFRNCEVGDMEEILSYVTQHNRSVRGCAACA